MKQKLREINIINQATPLIIIAILYVCIIVLSLNNGFFWDSITVLSRPANFLFENGLFNFHYPEWENGDPQLVPLYIAFVWTLFGKSALITHLAFLPIVFFTLFGVYRLTQMLFDKKYASWIFTLTAINPCFITQVTGLYQDSFLILFAILILNSLLTNNKVRLSTYMLLLCMVSRRGILLVFGFMLAYFIYILLSNNKNVKHAIKQIYLPYLPATAFVLFFIIWRLYSYGWFFTTDRTTTGEITSLAGMIKNVAVLIRWFVDGGHIFLLLSFVLLFKLKDKRNFFEQNKLLIILFVALLIVMMCVTIPLANPFGARYFMLHYIILTLIVSKLIIETIVPKFRIMIFGLLTVLLFSGNFWIYPEKLSIAWDTSLSHLSYFDLRKQVTSYVEDNEIAFSSVGVGFPMYSSFKLIDVNNDERRFSSIDLEKNEYAVYSNIFNLLDDEIDILKNWELVKTFKSGTVFMRLYKKPSDVTS